MRGLRTGRSRGAFSDTLFEAFVTTKENGLGVGLAISQSIVESHGGKIWVAGNEPHGTTFHFTIPLVQGANHDA